MSTPTPPVVSPQDMTANTPALPSSTLGGIVGAPPSPAPQTQSSAQQPAPPVPSVPATGPRLTNVLDAIVKSSSASGQTQPGTSAAGYDPPAW